ncbi:TniQ family protein [Streptomyces sp. NPDC051993]|uniref:TniQ family protein n=1 Tax=Streptomyces sp. NPDC051993 TaxID=3155286 RepID=UPI0034245548
MGLLSWSMMQHVALLDLGLCRTPGHPRASVSAVCEAAHRSSRSAHPPTPLGYGATISVGFCEWVGVVGEAAVLPSQKSFGVSASPVLSSECFQGCVGWADTPADTPSCSCRRRGVGLHRPLSRGNRRKLLCVHHVCENLDTMMHASILRVAPLAGETTWSFVCRVAASYGMAPGALLPWWEQTNGRPRHASGEPRADAEILLNPASQQMLAQLSGAEGGSLARALPTWPLGPAVFEDRADGERPLLRWQTGAAALEPVAFGCRLCTARRTGAEVRVMRYAQRWERVCVRHGRWALDADADQLLEHLDLRGIPEVTAAQRRWSGVARHAARAGTDPGEVFGLAYRRRRPHPAAPAHPAHRQPGHPRLRHRAGHRHQGTPQTAPDHHRLQLLRLRRPLQRAHPAHRLTNTPDALGHALSSRSGFQPTR